MAKKQKLPERLPAQIFVVPDGDTCDDALVYTTLSALIESHPDANGMEIGVYEFSTRKTVVKETKLV